MYYEDREGNRALLRDDDPTLGIVILVNGKYMMCYSKRYTAQYRGATGAFTKRGWRKLAQIAIAKALELGEGGE